MNEAAEPPDGRPTVGLAETPPWRETEQAGKLPGGPEARIAQSEGSAYLDRE